LTKLTIWYKLPLNGRADRRPEWARAINGEPEPAGSRGAELKERPAAEEQVAAFTANAPTSTGAAPIGRPAATRARHA